jgi:hypothetical protein
MHATGGPAAAAASQATAAPQAAASWSIWSPTPAQTGPQQQASSSSSSSTGRPGYPCSSSGWLG